MLVTRSKVSLKAMLVTLLCTELGRAVFVFTFDSARVSILYSCDHFFELNGDIPSTVPVIEISLESFVKTSPCRLDTLVADGTPLSDNNADGLPKV